MACFSIICSNGLFVKSDNMVVNLGKGKPFGSYGSFCSSYRGCQSLPRLFTSNKFECLPKGGGKFSLLGIRCCKSPDHILTKTRAETRNDGNGRLRKSTKTGNVKGSSFRKRFSLRLRPRLRLLSAKMKKVSVRSMMESIAAFVRKNSRSVSIYTLISLALGFCYLFLRLTALPSPKIVPYSDFILDLQDGSVTKVLLEEGSRRIYYNVKSPQVDHICDSDSVSARVSSEKESDGVSGEGNLKNGQIGMSNVNAIGKMRKTRGSVPQWEYSTRKIDHDQKYLIHLMREKGITYSSAPQSVLMSIRSTLITLITLWIPLIPFMWLLHRQLSGANNTARKKKPYSQMVGFDDVQGVDTAKLELMEIVSCLQGSLAYQKLGAKLPRGVLLVGPPGTGKTLLARAVAGEAGVPFFTVSASEFVEMFVGRGAARIRDLFSTARKYAPSIIFIDELDAVGGRRGRSFNDERDQTLNQLLTEMDGFESEMKVVVIAATNRPEALDPALCRPGRFSRKVVVGEPDEEGRKKILAVHLREVPLEEDSEIICHLVASLTPGFVGADLANIVNEAALLAARRGGETVAREDIMAAVERAKFGINDNKLRPATLSKELGKLFPWIPSLGGRSSSKPDGLQGPLGYQTLS